MAIALGWDYLSQEMKVRKICLNNGCIWQTQNVVNINLKEKRRKEKKKGLTRNKRMVKGARHLNPGNNYFLPGRKGKRSTL